MLVGSIRVVCVLGDGEREGGIESAYVEHAGSSTCPSPLGTIVPCVDQVLCGVRVVLLVMIDDVAYA